MHQQVICHLETANATYKTAADKHRQFKEFEVGDLVMVYLRKERFPAVTYHKLNIKKIGPCRIMQRCGENAYRVELPDDLHISYVFNKADLFEYHPPDSGFVSASKLEVELSNCGED